jgi:7,8-dihydroneopterin aldolase/epimerase/oxygenase
MLDRLVLRGITAFGRHGVLEEERKGQRFVIDVVLGIDASAAAAADDLAATVDYAELAAAVRSDVESEPVRLLETLAQRVAELCLRRPPVRWAEVTVHKPSAPMSVTVQDVAVTVTRSRT